MEITRSSQSNRKSSPANFSPGEKSAGVVAAPVIDQWSTRTPEKPIPNRMPRTVLSLKDVREAARKLRKPDPVRREVSDPFLSSDELKSPLVSESPAPASERKKDVNSVKLPEKQILWGLQSIHKLNYRHGALRDGVFIGNDNKIRLSCFLSFNNDDDVKSLKQDFITFLKLVREAAIKHPCPGQSQWNEINYLEALINHFCSRGKVKYHMLEEFFNSMDSSIRLLHLKGSATTFTNISAKIESLINKRFTYSNLAQLKFILPEAIEIKILKHDVRSCCMKPDLYITLNANAVDNSEKWKANSRSVILRKVFRSRLLDFFKSHPEGDDIPEGMLPGSFTESKQAETNSSRPSGSSLTTEAPNGASPLQSVALSHMSESFRTCFSNQASINGGTDVKEKDRVGLVPIPPPSIPFKVTSSTKKKTVACADAPNLSLKQSSSMKCSAGGIVLSSSPCHAPAPPMTEAKEGEDGFMSAPATPMLEPPKRCYMSPDDDRAESPIKLARRQSTRRSLLLDTPAKIAKAADKVCESGRFSTDDILDILPENLLQSRGEKESEALAEQNPAISQAKKRKQMIACLPRLFDMIYFLFQSIKRSVMTKEELMQRVISSHLEIKNRNEAEQQLILLQELAPEWIYEKLASGGTLLLVVNKISNPGTIRSRIAEAN